MNIFEMLHFPDFYKSSQCTATKSSCFCLTTSENQNLQRKLQSVHLSSSHFIFCVLQPCVLSNWCLSDTQQIQHCLLHLILGFPHLQNPSLTHGGAHLKCFFYCNWNSFWPSSFSSIQNTLFVPQGAIHSKQVCKQIHIKLIYTYEKDKKVRAKLK